MLKFFSRLERTRNLVLLFFAVFMAASLVFFYAPTRNTVSENIAQSNETVAKVGGENITVGEVVTQKESFGRRFGSTRAIPSKYLIDGIIRERMVRVEANR